MQNSTINNSNQTGKSNIFYMLMAGTLLTLLTLSTQGMADQQIQQPALGNTLSSQATSSDVAENYGDINDEEDGYSASNDGGPAEVMSQRVSGFRIMLAMNDEIESPAAGAYGDTLQDED